MAEHTHPNPLGDLARALALVVSAEHLAPQLEGLTTGDGFAIVTALEAVLDGASRHLKSAMNVLEGGEHYV